jgi:hypothetical protein
VRDEDTGELLNSWSFRTLKETRGKKMEQEEALDPAGHQTVVAVETTLTGTADLPPKILKQQI